jgi:hypothetical protein
MKNELKIQVFTTIGMEKRKLFHLAEGISSADSNRFAYKLALTLSFLPWDRFRNCPPLTPSLSSNNDSGNHRRVDEAVEDRDRPYLRIGFAIGRRWRPLSAATLTCGNHANEELKDRQVTEEEEEYGSKLKWNFLIFLPGAAMVTIRKDARLRCNIIAVSYHSSYNMHTQLIKLKLLGRLTKNLD